MQFVRFGGLSWLGLVFVLAVPASAEPTTAAPQVGTWVVHRVIPGERLSEIAARYASDESEIKQDNGLADDESDALPPGETLRVRARKVPPDSGLGLGIDVDTAGLPLAPVAPFAESLGRPDRGRLRRGARLPDNPALYFVRRPKFAYGSSHTVHYLQLALAKFRQYSAYRGALVVSDMSRERGGRYGPHHSHQSGRDVDLWLPRRAEATPPSLAPGIDELAFARFAAERVRDVDWRATWELVKALVRTGQVQYIFLSRSRQRFLHRAARAAGASREQLAELIQYPRRARTGIVRHERKHDKHMHIRFECAAAERRCR